MTHPLVAPPSSRSPSGHCVPLGSRAAFLPWEQEFGPQPRRCFVPWRAGWGCGDAPSSLAPAPSTLLSSQSPHSPPSPSSLCSTLGPYHPPLVPSFHVRAPSPRSPFPLLLPYSFPYSLLQIPSAPPPTPLPCAPPSLLPHSSKRPSSLRSPLLPWAPPFLHPRPSSLGFPNPLPWTLPSSPNSPPSSRSSHAVAMEAPAASGRLAGAALGPWGQASDCARLWLLAPSGPRTKRALPHLGRALWDLLAPPGGGLRPPGIYSTPTSVGRTLGLGWQLRVLSYPPGPPRLLPLLIIPTPIPEESLGPGGQPDGPI